MFPLSHMLRRFVQSGCLYVFDPDGKRHVFQGAEPGPEVTMRLHDRALIWRLVLNPELAAGEAYMDGTLTFENGGVAEFLRLFARNRYHLADHPVQVQMQKLRLALRRFHNRRINRQKAQKNVAHHYDLNRELYELFLDRDMQYSCAYFIDPEDTLEQAQAQKKRHIAAKLQLADGQRILDIGCGWGGMALYLAQCADVDVLGITLSTEQLDLAMQRAEAAGLADRVKFELKDYRELDGTFDRIVSVGMFEHVGTANYWDFFAQINRLLDPDGVALLHSIGHMSPPSTASPWLDKYIFPGGYSPALSEVLTAVEPNQLWVTDIEVLRVHYAQTLEEWNRRFQANRARIAEIYDERFCRMWEFYLISCAQMFRTGAQMVFQMQLAHKRDAVPLTRNYMFENERRLAEAGDIANAAE
ncbi:MAG TPA: SAM-dependent methyltransferase [Alphaproteobacteria bacterium]|nr:SAM-dependent methyltransferase [Alphaproteobacteria bacterium]HBF99778.1 SAM-dependent methyltransferase [Alphaproteobacteria bacterium]